MTCASVRQFRVNQRDPDQPMNQQRGYYVMTMPDLWLSTNDVLAGGSHFSFRLAIVPFRLVQRQGAWAS